MIITCPHCGALADKGDVYCPGCHRNIAPGDQNPDLERETPSPIARRSEIIGIGVILCLLVVASIVVYSSRRGTRSLAGAELADQKTCMSNLKQIAVAAHMYLVDHSMTNFPRQNYQKSLLPYLKGAADTSCPATDNEYGTNRETLGATLAGIPEPSKTPYFFDAIGPDLDYPHGDMANVAFVDTSTKRVDKKTKLKFKP